MADLSFLYWKDYGKSLPTPSQFHPSTDRALPLEENFQGHTEFLYCMTSSGVQPMGSLQMSRGTAQGLENLPTSLPCCSWTLCSIWLTCGTVLTRLHKISSWRSACTQREHMECFQSPGPPLDTGLFRSFVSDTHPYCILSKPFLRCWRTGQNAFHPHLCFKSVCHVGD